MRQKLYLSALVAASLIGMSGSALAQTAGAGTGVAPGMGGVPPVGTTPPGTTTTNPGSAGITAAPGGPSTTGVGSGAGASQPGVPNTSTPGIIGTGAAPSGLPGDDPAHPGFPRRLGN
jgi:hypothetical protein